MAQYINKDTYVGDTGKQLKDIKTNADNISVLGGKITNVENVLNGLIKIVDIATDKFSFNSGNRYRGAINYTLPSGYVLISIMTCYTAYGDRNFMDYNLYYESNQIYYEIYCQYGFGTSMGNSNFRLVFAKTSVS